MHFDLEKREQKVRDILEKKNLPQVPPMRAGLAMDISGSTAQLYKKGIMQETVNRLLAIALRFDDNGELDMWTFDNSMHRLPSANKSNYERYVNAEILDNSSVSKWGGTSYAPVMNDVVDLYFRGETKTTGGLFGLFGKKERVKPGNTSMPAICLFVTDGQNDDRERAARILREAQGHPVYWQLVGVGNPKEFGFLRDMAEELPNVGFIHLERLDISDDELYERLLSDELCTWVKAH